jgi:hypothetical protein
MGGTDVASIESNSQSAFGDVFSVKTWRLVNKSIIKEDL